MSLRTTSWLLPLTLIAAAACSSEGSNDDNGGVLPTAGNGGFSGGGAGGVSGAAGMAGGTSGVGGGGGVGGSVVAGNGGIGGGAGAGAGGVGGGTGGTGGPVDCASTVEGALFSPGGTVLPHPCEPFHATTNNPYAVRCVDAWSWYDSGFPGDDFCILPPPPDKGVQYGVHPQGKDWYAQVSTGDMSGYSNPPADFLLPSGGEGERNYYTTAGVPNESNYYRNYARMRAGSHHMIVSANPPNASLETWGAGSPDGLFSGTSMPGAQRPDENNPKSLDKPGEDAGYYQVLPGATGITFDMHHFNATEGDILKEAWTNLWFEEDATKKVTGLRGLDLLLAVGGLSVAPQTTKDYHYEITTTERVRILTLFGHRHAWTTNFSAWIDKGGTNEIIYQSFDWYDEPTYRYDSLTMNPVPNHMTFTDGALSGVQWLEPGQKLHFNCRIQYTDARAAAVNSPVTPDENGTLTFANQAFEAEMCILFGSTAEGPPIGGVVGSLDPLPDFATAE